MAPVRELLIQLDANGSSAAWLGDVAAGGGAGRPAARGVTGEQPGAAQDYHLPRLRALRLADFELSFQRVKPAASDQRDAAGAEGVHS